MRYIMTNLLLVNEISIECTLKSLRNKFNFSTEWLKSNLCHFDDIYMLFKGNITFVRAPVAQVA